VLWVGLGEAQLASFVDIAEKKQRSLISTAEHALRAGQLAVPCSSRFQALVQCLRIWQQIAVEGGAVFVVELNCYHTRGVPLLSLELVCRPRSLVRGCQVVLT
jgi:hypothetical protein